jgi:hypothetical protein
VVSDLVRDFGVFPIWTSVVTGLLAVLFWLPVRMFFVRGEMLFIKKDGLVVAYSRAEGARRRQNAQFHDALDLLDESPHEN